MYDKACLQRIVRCRIHWVGHTVALRNGNLDKVMKASVSAHPLTFSPKLWKEPNSCYAYHGGKSSAVHCWFGPPKELAIHRGLLKESFA